MRHPSMIRLKNRVGLYLLLYLLSAFPAAASVRISWQANTESDLAGYKIYYGMSPGTYTTILDVGNAVQYTFNALIPGMTYYLAVTAYDAAGNESGYSTEVSFKVEDTVPPQITGVSCTQVDRVVVVFNEAVEMTSAELVTNYQITNGIVVQSAHLQSDNVTIYLYTTQHAVGSYVLTVNGVKDRADVPNMIANGTQVGYTYGTLDTTRPTVSSVELYRTDFLAVQFSETLNQASALTLSNYSISPSVTIDSLALDLTCRKVYISTGNHTPGVQYTITFNNIQDAANPPNTILPNSQKTYLQEPTDTQAPALIAVRVKSATELELQFNEVLDPVTSQQPGRYTITPQVAVNSAILRTDNSIVTLTTAAHAGGSYTVSASGIGDQAVPMNAASSVQLGYTYSPPDQVAPALLGMELTGNNLITLHFSEPLEQASAESVSNYSIQPQVAILSAMLSVSEKMVILQTGSHSQGTYRITLAGIRDKSATPNTIAQNTGADYSYSPPDDTPPALASAQLHGASMVELRFSESLNRTTSQNSSNYSITPSVAVLSAALVGDSLNHVYLATGPHTPGQTYTVTVNGIMDKAEVPNTIAPNSRLEYAYPAVDATPPELVSVSLPANIMLEALFSEPLDRAAAENEANFIITPALTVEEATLDASLKKVFLKTAGHQPGRQYTLTVLNVTDCASPANPIGAANTRDYLCQSTDVIPPRLLRAEIHGDRTVELNFSEPLEASSALTAVNYEIAGAAGIVVQQVSLSNSQMDVFLETTPHLKGLYTVTVSHVQDMAALPNAISANNTASYDYSPPDTTGPVFLAVSFMNPTTLELTFDEMLQRASAEDTAHYAVSGITVLRAILDISATRVILQTTEHVPGTYTLIMNGIADASTGANRIASNTVGRYSYVPEDRIPPVITSAELRNERMLLVNFSETVDSWSAQNKANYVINKNVTVESATLAASQNQVILQTTTHASGEYILTVSHIQDASAAKNTIAAYSQAAYVWVPLDTVAPELASVTLHTNQYMELEFSEPIDAAQAQVAGNFSITPLVRVQRAVLDISLTHVWLFTEPHAPGSYLITVSHIQDKSFTPNTIGLAHNQLPYSYTPPDTAAPALISTALRTPMSLALVFDEPLGRNAAEDIAHYTITPAIEIRQAYLLASLTTVHLETSAHEAGVTYTVQIDGLEDRAPIPNVLSRPITAQYVYSPPDTTAPELIAAKLQGTSLLELVFSEKIEKMSAENRLNYRIDPMVEILNASLDSASLSKVYLETTNHLPGITYGINARNIRDRAPIPNVIRPTAWLAYTLSGSGSAADQTPPQVARIDVVSSTAIDVVFTEPVDKTSSENRSNYSIAGGVSIQSAVLDTVGVRVHLVTSAHAVGRQYQISVAGVRDQAALPNVLASAFPVKYLLGQNVIVSNLSTCTYGLQIFNAGDTSYVDRDYTVQNSPQSLEGTVQVMTANGDKCSGGGNFLRFELNRDAILYVAFDRRIEVLPDWLSTWRATGEQVVDSRQNVFNLYASEVLAGRVTLGGNAGTMDDAMYLIFVAPHTSSEQSVCNLNRPAYQLKHLAVGDIYYIDRDYTLSSIPTAMKDFLWIQTANDDKLSREENFLSFTLTQRSRIYVATDSRMASLPKWLLEWDGAEGQIVDSRGTRFDIVSKTFEAGEAVLGGNCGTMDDAMYLVLVEVLESQGGPGTELPGYFTLEQNYPNPFNPETSIYFKAHKNGPVQLSVYNILGQKVKTLVDREMAAGHTETVIWDGTDSDGIPVASGVYFYQIRQGQFALSKRMLLMR